MRKDDRRVWTPERIERRIERIERRIEKLGDLLSGTRCFPETFCRLPALGVDGKIVAVNHKVQMVMIDRGLDAGVHRGMHMTVYSGDGYLGKVVVEEVWKNMCSARIDARYARGKVAEGNDVTTRIR